MHIGSVVNGKFTVVSRLGTGSFSTVYQGREELTLKSVAIKVLNPDTPSISLANEMKAIQACKETPGVPRIYHSGKVGETPYIVMELLGSDLLSLLCQQGKFPIPLVVQIAIQTLQTLEGIHAAGYLHLDIKPDNILLKRKKDSIRCYMIDFGLSKKYMLGGKHYVWSDRSEFRGNLVFASRHILRHYSPSRRDDLESLIYTLAFIANGSLPWTLGEQGILKGPRDQLAHAKGNINPRTICGVLPPEFAEILSNVRALPFAETPNYAHYAKLLESLQASLQMASPEIWTDLLTSSTPGSLSSATYSNSEETRHPISPFTSQITAQSRQSTQKRLTRKIEDLRIVRSTKRHLVVLGKPDSQQVDEGEVTTVEVDFRTIKRKPTDKKEVIVTHQFRTRLQAMRSTERATRVLE